MTPLEIRMAGRIMALEFVIEVMLANQLAGMPETMSASFKQDMLEHPPYAPIAQVDPELLGSIRRDMRACLENLLRKVNDREADIRQQIDPQSVH
jgi:hypothetical protein